MQSRQRCITCHLDGGPLFEITPRTRTTVKVRHTDDNRPLPLGAATSRRPCACAHRRPSTRRGDDSRTGPRASRSGVSVHLSPLPGCAEAGGWLSGMTAREEQGAQIGQRLPPPPPRWLPCDLGQTAPHPGPCDGRMVAVTAPSD